MLFAEEKARNVRYPNFSERIPIRSELTENWIPGKKIDYHLPTVSTAIDEAHSPDMTAGTRVRGKLEL